MLDISFFDQEGTIIKKNFNIPDKIDLSLYLNPTLTEDCGTRYEAFGIVVIDQGQTQTLIKKRLKSVKKNQWFLFSDGQYQPIEQEQAFSNYMPYMVFYK